MTLYFNNAVDTAWDTLGNWWTNAGCTSAAAAIPATGDTVIVVDAATLGSVPAVAVQPASIQFVATGGSGAAMADVNLNLSGFTCVVEFNGSSYCNAGVALKTVTFNDNSNCDAASIETGICNDLSYVSGDCACSDITLNDNSSTRNTITVNAVYNNNAYNAGTVENAIFNNTSSNGGGQITNATFNDDSINVYGALVINAIFNGNSVNYDTNQLDASSMWGNVTNLLLPATIVGGVITFARQPTFPSGIGGKITKVVPTGIPLPTDILGTGML